METLTLIVVILQVLGAVLSIVLRCYQLYKETKKEDNTKKESEPSVCVRVAHLDENAVDIFDISIH